jgi:hypothetical protein
VQIKNGLDDPAWTNLGPVVLAAAKTASLTDPTGAILQQRLYRVVIVD